MSLVVTSGDVTLQSAMPTADVAIAFLCKIPAIDGEHRFAVQIYRDSNNFLGPIYVNNTNPPTIGGQMRVEGTFLNSFAQDNNLLNRWLRVLVYVTPGSVTFKYKGSGGVIDPGGSGFPGTFDFTGETLRLTTDVAGVKYRSFVTYTSLSPENETAFFAGQDPTLLSVSTQIDAFPFLSTLANTKNTGSPAVAPSGTSFDADDNPTFSDPPPVIRDAVLTGPSTVALSCTVADGDTLQGSVGLQLKRGGVVESLANVLCDDQTITATLITPYVAGDDFSVTYPVEPISGTLAPVCARFDRIAYTAVDSTAWVLGVYAGNKRDDVESVTFTVYEEGVQAGSPTVVTTKGANTQTPAHPVALTRADVYRLTLNKNDYATGAALRVDAVATSATGRTRSISIDLWNNPTYVVKTVGGSSPDYAALPAAMASAGDNDFLELRLRTGTHTLDTRSGGTIRASNGRRIRVTRDTGTTRAGVIIEQANGNIDIHCGDVEYYDVSLKIAEATGSGADAEHVNYQPAWQGSAFNDCAINCNIDCGTSTAELPFISRTTMLLLYAGLSGCTVTNMPYTPFTATALLIGNSVTNCYSHFANDPRCMLNNAFDGLKSADETTHVAGFFVYTPGNEVCNYVWANNTQDNIEGPGLIMVPPGSAILIEDLDINGTGVGLGIDAPSQIGKVGTGQYSADGVVLRRGVMNQRLNMIATEPQLTPDQATYQNFSNCLLDTVEATVLTTEDNHGIDLVDSTTNGTPVTDIVWPDQEPDIEGASDNPLADFSDFDVLVPPADLAADQVIADIVLTWTENGASNNIYRDGVLIGESADGNFTDLAPGAGTYEYQVSAVNAYDVETVLSAVVEVIVTDSADIDVTAPTALSFRTNQTGSRITGAFSEIVATLSNQTGNFTLSGTSATVASWTAGDTGIVLILSGTVAEGETVTIAYDAAGGIEDLAGNALATFSGRAVTNGVHSGGGSHSPSDSSKSIVGNLSSAVFSTAG